MNDIEIIKTLKHLRTSTLNGWREKKITEKDLNTISYALDLINRQQAEIERLNIDLKAMRGAANSYKAHYEDLKSENLETIKILKTAKSEAVREFAESLKRKSELVAPSVWAIPYRAVAVADIDRLIEEMGCNDG